LTSRGARPEELPDDPAALLAQFRKTLPADVRAATRIAVRVIRAARAAGDKVHELRGYWALSSAAAVERRMSAVLEIIERALLCDAARDDDALRARTRLGRGTALIHFGRLDDARREALEALDVLGRAGDARGQATAHELLAHAAIEMARYRDAVGHLQAQRTTLGNMATPLGLAWNEETEASCRVGLFEFSEAHRLLESACGRFRSVGAGFEADQARYNCAYLYLKSGRYADALRLYAELADTLAHVPNEWAIRALCVDRAELLLEIGAVSEAREWTTRAVESAVGSLSAKDELRTRLILAETELLDGDASTAMRLASAAAAGFENLSDACGVAESLITCSASALASGQVQKARQFAVEAVARFDHVGAGAAACEGDFALCRAAVALRDFGSADSALARAAARSGMSALPWASIELRRHRAMVLAARGDDEGAAQLLDRAVCELDARRGLLPPDALRSAFLSLHAPLYREAVDVHARLGRYRRAFELAASSKSRALLDLMAGGAGLDETDGPRFDALRLDLGAAYAKLHALSLRPTTDAEFAEAQARAENGEREMADLVARSFNRRVESEVLRAPQTSAELQACLAADEALIEYAFGADRLHAFVVTRDAVRWVGLDVPPAAVARLVKKFAFHLSSAMHEPDVAGDADAIDAVRSNLSALRELLVDPLGILGAVRRVVVAPDGVLHGVPFHAMPVGDSWWSDDVLVTYAPSALVHAHCLRGIERTTGAAHVFAVPDDSVPEIRTEARVVAETLGPRAVVHIEESATWNEFVAAAGDAALLHVATHGLSRTESVVGGSVRLADGWLTQFDLYRIRVGARLVVLSACDSGATRFEASGDPFGLARGFLCAGARTLVASRWRVDDRTTAEWMRSFYERLSAGASVGDAYVDACRAVRAKRAHPFHWAPFVLTGDPKIVFFF